MRNATIQSAGGTSVEPYLRFERVMVAVLALAGVLIYAPTLRNDYVLDDVFIVASNPMVNQGHYWQAISEPYWPNPGGLSTPASNWRPLASLSLAVTHAVSAESAVVWHHAINAVLHGLLVLVLFPLARRFVGAGWPALLATALFAGHPAHSEAVAPVVARTDLIAAIGFLAALELFLQYRETKSTWRLAASVTLYVIGLGGKEAAIPLVVLLPFVDVLLFGTPFRSFLHKTLGAYLPFLAVLVAYLGLRWAVLGGHSFVHGGAAELDTLERLVFAGKNAVFSLGLLVAPLKSHHLLTTLPANAPFSYPVPEGPSAVIWVAAGSAVFFGWLFWVRRSPTSSFLWLGGLLPWIPTSGIFPAGAGVALRYLLIPSAFAACLLVRVSDRWASSRPRAAVVLRVCLLAIAILGAVISFSRTAMWKNNGTLYQRVLEEYPECYTARFGMSAWLLAKNPPDVAGAIAQARRAVTIAGDHRSSLVGKLNLAIAYEHGTFGVRYGEGARLEEAVAIYSQLTVQYPERWDIHFNFAVVLDLQDKLVEALPHLEAILELSPPGFSMRSWVLLKCAWAHGRLGSTDRAVELLQRLTVEHANSPEAGEARAQLLRIGAQNPQQ